MKTKIKVKDFEGKEQILVRTERGIDHLKAQQIHKHKVFRDKTKYTRKQKHKNSEY